MLNRQGAPDAVRLYRTLRRINPAPYAGGPCWVHAAGAAFGAVGGSNIAEAFDTQIRAQLTVPSLPAAGGSYMGLVVELCFFRPHKPRRAAAQQPEPLNPLRPCAAWLRFAGGAPQLCCCSPERFLRGDRGGQLEAKPIKGTAPRFPADPEADARSAAELAGGRPAARVAVPAVLQCQTEVVAGRWQVCLRVGCLQRWAPRLPSL